MAHKFAAVSSSRTRSRASRKFWPTARDASSSNQKPWAFRFSAQLILYLMKCFIYQLKGNQSRPVRRMLMVWQLKRFNPVLKYDLCTLSSSILHDRTEIWNKVLKDSNKLRDGSGFASSRCSYSRGAARLKTLEGDQWRREWLAAPSNAPFLPHFVVHHFSRHC